ncbi:MAG: ABC transporter permease [Ignavibacteriaceae bacterium]|nr:ABC transporter permease [Ignavibacteriaceae bacterium]
MFSKKTLIVIKRELRDKLFSKTFILMTVLIPVFMFGILGIQTFLMSFESDSGTNLTVVSENQDLAPKLQTAFNEAQIVKSGSYKINVEIKTRDEFDEYVLQNKKSLLGDKLTGIVFIPKQAEKDKKVEYYSKNPNNNSLLNKTRSIINKALIDYYFTGRNLSNEDIFFARESVDFSTFRVGSDDKVEEEGYGNQIIAFLFTFLLYFSLIFLGTMMMRAVVEEKHNRIVELLLSSVSSKELMTGKILGNGITGLIQMSIWLLPIMVLISSSVFVLPPELILKINMAHIAYFLFNFFVGLITFLGLFATVGAIFDNDQDAQSGLWPIMILIMIPFFISIAMLSNSENPIATIASMVPFASLIVMPARMTIIEVPVWQFALAIVVNVGTLLLIFPAAGKIYRVGILMTGKKPKWSEIIRWLKYKY